MPQQFLPMILQGIISIYGLKLFRAATALLVPAFKYEGFLWLQDLTVPGAVTLTAGKTPK